MSSGREPYIPKEWAEHILGSLSFVIGELDTGKGIVASIHEWEMLQWIFKEYPEFESEFDEVKKVIHLKEEATA